MAEKHIDTNLQEKGDIMNCGNYRDIKLMCHSMKLYICESACEYTEKHREHK